MKKKKHLSEHLPSSQFILLMGLIYALGTGIGTLLVVQFAQNTSFGLNWSYIYSILSSTLPIALIVSGESLLLKLQFKWDAHKWLITSLIGIIGIVIWGLIQSFVFPIFIPTLSMAWLFRRIPLLILSLAQFVALRQVVKRAWLWIIGSVGFSFINIVLFSAIWSTFGVQFGSPMMASLVTTTLVSGIQGTVLAMVMTTIVRLSMKDAREAITEEDAEIHSTNTLTDHAPQAIDFDERDLAQLRQNRLSG